MSDASGRVARSALQLIAGGGLAALVAAVADGLGPVAAATLALVNTFLVTACQNTLEERGAIPTLFKPAVTGTVTDASGTVVAELAGATPAEVEGVAGTVITDEGEIVGAVGPPAEEDGNA